MDCTLPRNFRRGLFMVVILWSGCLDPGGFWSLCVVTAPPVAETSTSRLFLFDEAFSLAALFLP